MVLQQSALPLHPALPLVLPAVRVRTKVAGNRPATAVDFSVRIWRADLDPAVEASTGGGVVGTQQPLGHEGYSVNTVAVSPDCRLVATGAGE